MPKLGFLAGNESVFSLKSPFSVNSILLFAFLRFGTAVKFPCSGDAPWRSEDPPLSVLMLDPDLLLVDIASEGVLNTGKYVVACLCYWRVAPSPEGEFDAVEVSKLSS